MRQKLKELASLSLQNPVECYDRIVSAIESRVDASRNSRPQYKVDSEETVLTQLGDLLGAAPGRIFGEPAYAEIERAVSEGKRNSAACAPFGLFHNGDAVLARICYFVARALRPLRIIETGVCYGVTTAYLLKALEVNSAGTLQSIDLPPLGKDGDLHVGNLIPAELRGRWDLRRGATRRLLQQLLRDRTPVGLFIHDSLHTYHNMQREIGLAWPCLQSGGVLIADDIENNAAFQELSARPDVRLALVLGQASKDARLGIAVKA